MNSTRFRPTPIRTLKSFLTAPCLALILSGCTYVSYSDNKADWYAAVEKPLSGDLYIVIMAKEWIPLINPSGFGGPREYRLDTIALDGAGPIYHAHSTLNQSSKFPDYGGDYESTVSIDFEKEKAVVDLKRNAAKSGEPPRIVEYRDNGKFKVTRGLEIITPQK